MDFMRNDHRINDLIDWLMMRYKDLELEYKIATTYSLGMMITAYEYEFTNGVYYHQIIEALDEVQIPPERIQEIPSLIFILPSFAETEEAYPMVLKVLE